MRKYSLYLDLQHDARYHLPFNNITMFNVKRLREEKGLIRGEKGKELITSSIHYNPSIINSLVEFFENPPSRDIQSITTLVFYDELKNSFTTLYKELFDLDEINIDVKWIRWDERAERFKNFPKKLRLFFDNILRTPRQNIEHYKNEALEEYNKLKSTIIVDVSRVIKKFIDRNNFIFDIRKFDIYDLRIYRQFTLGLNSWINEWYCTQKIIYEDVFQEILNDLLMIRALFTNPYILINKEPYEDYLKIPKGIIDNDIKFINDSIYDTLDNIVKGPTVIVFPTKIITKEWLTITYKEIEEKILLKFNQELLLLVTSHGKEQQLTREDIVSQLYHRYQSIINKWIARFTVVRNRFYDGLAYFDGPYSECSANHRWDEYLVGIHEIFKKIDSLIANFKQQETAQILPEGEEGLPPWYQPSEKVIRLFGYQYDYETNKMILEETRKTFERYTPKHHPDKIITITPTTTIDEFNVEKRATPKDKSKLTVIFKQLYPMDYNYLYITNVIYIILNNISQEYEGTKEMGESIQKIRESTLWSKEVQKDWENIERYNKYGVFIKIPQQDEFSTNTLLTTEIKGKEGKVVQVLERNIKIYSLVFYRYNKDTKEGQPFYAPPGWTFEKDKLEQLYNGLYSDLNNTILKFYRLPNDEQLKEESYYAWEILGGTLRLFHDTIYEEIPKDVESIEGRWVIIENRFLMAIRQTTLEFDTIGRYFDPKIPNNKILIYANMIGGFTLSLSGYAEFEIEQQKQQEQQEQTKEEEEKEEQTKEEEEETKEETKEETETEKEEKKTKKPKIKQEPKTPPSIPVKEEVILPPKQPELLPVKKEKVIQQPKLLPVKKE